MFIVNCQNNQIRSQKSHSMLINMCGIVLKPKKIVEPNIIFLHCFKGVIPRFYRFIKFIKCMYLFALLCLFINSPTRIYDLSKFLSLILHSLLVNRYSVRNFKKFVDYVQNFTISISFDVVSLFTSAPVDKALGLV